MNSTHAPVPFKTFEMPLVAGTRPGSVERRPLPRPRPTNPDVNRVLTQLPEAATAVFVGPGMDGLAEAYAARHPSAALLSSGWNTEDMARTAAQAGLIVVSHPLDTTDDTVEDTVIALETLAAASAPDAVLVVAQARPPVSTDILCALLMDAGWMPDLVSPTAPEDQGADAGPVLQAVKRFGAESLTASGQVACFSVVVAGPGELQDPAAAMSPGLAEVQAAVTVVSGAESAAGAFEAARAELHGDWVLICHEDAYFPAGFGRRLNELLADVPATERAKTLIGFIGVGINRKQQGFAPVGFVVEQFQRQDHRDSTSVVSIDELALVVSRDSLHRIDPEMGWSLWGTDLCLTAICEHQVFPRVVCLPLMHRSGAPVDTGPAFTASACRLATKFPQFGPIPTLNGTIDATFLANRMPVTPAGVSAMATPLAAVPASAHAVATPAGADTAVVAPPAARPPVLSTRAKLTNTADAVGPADRAAVAESRCSVCNTAVPAWTPHPHPNRCSEFMHLLDVIGSDLSVYLCPACGCNDRDRHVWHYLRATGLQQRLPQLRVLHIAPERHLEVLIHAAQPVAYVRGDLFPRRPEHLKLNIEALPFDDGSFDLVICNHVLEHVGDPQRALAEFHRCLSPGGVVVAQTPYSPVLKHTMELNRPVSANFATVFYGQDDHVRLFGVDIAEYFHRAGFHGELRSHREVLGDMDARAQGCNGLEPFFAFTK